MRKNKRRMTTRTACRPSILWRSPMKPHDRQTTTPSIGSLPRDRIEPPPVAEPPSWKDVLPADGYGLLPELQDDNRVLPCRLRHAALLTIADARPGPRSYARRPSHPVPSRARGSAGWPRDGRAARRGSVYGVDMR